MQNIIEHSTIQGITELDAKIGLTYGVTIALPKSLPFDHLKTDVFLEQLVQTCYVRKR